MLFIITNLKDGGTEIPKEAHRVMRSHVSFLEFEAPFRANRLTIKWIIPA